MNRQRNRFRRRLVIIVVTGPCCWRRDHLLLLVAIIDLIDRTIGMLRGRQLRQFNLIALVVQHFK
jgi:hypothetical protein